MTNSSLTQISKDALASSLAIAIDVLNLVSSCEQETKEPELPNNAQVVRQLREQKGLTQEELSRLTGFTIKTIHKMETGVIQPTIAQLNYIYSL